MKKCIACGMPMQTAADYAQGDIRNDYCCHCARPDGSMQSYDEKLASMTAFLVRTSGIAESAARDAARTAMAVLPAWSKRIV